MSNAKSAGFSHRKVFLMAIPHQIDGTKTVYYRPMGNSSLDCPEGCAHPIIPLLNAYASKGDEVTLITLYQEGANNTDENKIEVEKIVRQLAESRGMRVNFDHVTTNNDNSVAAAAYSFGRLINKLQDGDLIYADITFGTKIVSIVLFMVLMYAHRMKENSSVECVVYGQAKWTEDENAKTFRSPSGKMLDEGKIYEETSLIYLDNIIDELSRIGVKDPAPILDDLFMGFERESQEDESNE